MMDEDASTSGVNQAGNGVVLDSEKKSESETEERALEHIHLPGRSYNPILIAFGITIAAYAALYDLLWMPLGIAVVLVGIFLWNWERP